LWDSLPPNGRKKTSAQSRRYACIANHDSFSHPTSLCSDYGQKVFGAANRKATSMSTNDSISLSDSDSSEGLSDWSTNDGDFSSDVVAGAAAAAASAMTISNPAPPVTPLFSPRQNSLKDKGVSISSLKEEIKELKEKV
jgi:hypothetical protein